MEHKMIDGTELVGWLMGQKSITPMPFEAKVTYEKIIIHVVGMMKQKGESNGTE